MATVHSGVYRSSYSDGPAGGHFALAWVNEVYGKLSALLPKGKDDIPSASDCRDIIAVESQDKALITEYLANKSVGKARKARYVDIDLNAQIAESSPAAGWICTPALRAAARTLSPFPNSLNRHQ